MKYDPIHIISRVSVKKKIDLNFNGDVRMGRRRVYTGAQRKRKPRFQVSSTQLTPGIARKIYKKTATKASIMENFEPHQLKLFRQRKNSLH